MKKFLRINLPHSEKEVPLTLDAAILASAAMRAGGIRKKRMFFKVAFPTVAAAAAIMMTTAGVFDGVFFSKKTVSPVEVVAHSQIEIVQSQNPAMLDSMVISDQAPAAELLALADFSVLEQESYNLASLAEFSIDGESVMI